MKREWKPGDVAWWEGERIFREGYNENNPGARWMSATNGECWPEEYVSAEEAPRPLVVIDPEDREQVERLAKAMHESDHIAPWHDLHNETRSQIEDAMQAALREFANPTPPKPEEPTGLGAVVEDEAGCWWVQFSSKTGNWWRNHQGRNLRWADLDAVRVLSEGVQP